jgi:hypothetical protein
MRSRRAVRAFDRLDAACRPFLRRGRWPGMTQAIRDVAGFFLPRQFNGCRLPLRDNGPKGNGPAIAPATRVLPIARDSDA